MKNRFKPKHRGNGMSLFDLPPECIREMMEMTKAAYPNFADFEADIKQKMQEAEEALAKLEEEGK